MCDRAALYRCFPSRPHLALAVFEENFAGLEALAAEPDPGAFARLWRRLPDPTVEETAFVEMGWTPAAASPTTTATGDCGRWSRTRCAASAGPDSWTPTPPPTTCCWPSAWCTAWP
ncbi:hypothetical protein NI17_018100 [Thermobifida halotolerans]|uniref:Uncharacterized protein n=1 Tax=Thermobifida halotolerans TaxID=483545 RepID=A0AA97LVF0_9ACTN|nr:hypothetical protein [Thermobifida halotolerans]UOE18691.1 hypothetical protein NI17_018100 [Thermobifida halotolerans]